MSASGTVSREQTQQKLDRRGPVAARYMASTPYTTADRLEECVRNFGERNFLTEGDVRYTYAQLNQRANQLVGRVAALDQAIVNGRGRVQIGDAFWDVEGPDLPVSTPVRVVAVNGMTLKVQQA